MEHLRSFPRPLLSRTIFLFVCILLGVPGCFKTPELDKTSDRPRLILSPFPDADKLFRRDPLWLGGDGASSIGIGNEEILWLFGDTFIGIDGSKNRCNSVMIRNSIAIQTGSNPVNAEIHFYYLDAKGRPAAYFQFPYLGEVWPSMGILVRNKLFVFLMSVVPVKSDLGFRINGWHCVSVIDRSLDPNAWSWRHVPSPAPLRGLPLILSFIFSEKQYVYGFMTHQTSHDIYLCRWLIDDFYNECLLSPSWWSASDKRWMKLHTLRNGSAIVPIIRNGQMEFSIEWRPLLKQYVLIQCQGFGNTPIGIRKADHLTGPWSPFTPLFFPPFSHRKSIVTYAAKSHPEQKGGHIIITYAVNSLDFQELLSDNQIYFPYFLKGTVVHAP